MAVENSSNFFSVIVPCVALSQAINASIQSVLKQEYQNFELLLLIPKKNADDFTGIIPEAEANSKIKILLIAYGDLHVANIFGIKQAAGNYICFLSPGDEWYVHHLSTFNKAIKNNREAKVFFTRPANSFGDNASITVSEKTNLLSAQELKPGFSWMLTQVCVERNFANNESLPALKLAAFSDKFIIRCWLINSPCVVINKITSNTHSESRKRKITEEFMDKEILTSIFISRNKLFEIAAVKKLFRSTYFWLLGYLLRRGSFLTFSKYLIRYIKTIRRINFNHS